MNPKIVDGINLETGEIVDDSVIIHHELEEVEINYDRDDRVRIMSMMWPNNHIHFDTDESGFMLVVVSNWHANIEMPISVKFAFKGGILVITYPLMSKGNSIRVNTLVDIDDMIENKKVLNMEKAELAKFKATMRFRHMIANSATKSMEALQSKSYKVTMVTKMDCMLYARLDHKVLIDESLVEKLVARDQNYAITNKDDEKILYLYQSLLEEKTVSEIINLIRQNGH